MTGSSAALKLRVANASDANAVATLHAESWRHHYRGAYSDACLDGNVAEDRLAVWSERLSQPDPNGYTILAVERGGLVGFAHTIFDEDPTWGALLDNLHVRHDRKREGVGTRLMTVTAKALLERPTRAGLYLWVLEQTVAAQAFYRPRRDLCGPAPREPARWGPRPPSRIAGGPTLRLAQPGDASRPFR